MPRCFHNGLSRGVFERKFLRRAKKLISKIKSIAAFSRFFIDRSFAAFRTLMKYTGTNFLSMEVFKEFILDLMLEAVDMLSRF